MNRPLTLRRVLPVGLMLASLGCTGGLNCGSGCTSDYVYGTTAASVPNGVTGVDDGVRMRMSQGGLDFIQSHLKDILIAQFSTLPGDPNTLAIPIGSQVINDSNPRVNLGVSTSTNNQGQPIETFNSAILINIAQLQDQLDFNFEDTTNGIRLSIRDLPVGIRARVYGDIDFGLGTSDGACDVSGAQAGGIVSNISFDILIKPDVGRGAQCTQTAPGQECLLISVEVTSFALGGLDVDLTNPGPCNNGQCTSGSRVCSDPFFAQSDDFECDFACGIGDFAVDALTAIVDFLENNLNFLIRPVLENAINNALAGVNGAPIAASGRFDIATAATGILPESALDLGYSIAPTGSAFDVNGSGSNLGMDLILKSGFEAAPPLDENELTTVPHPCTRPIVGQEFAALFGDGVRGQFETASNDALTGSFNGAPYHLGASLAKPALNQMMFALYNSGSLCIEVTSDGIHSLGGGAFELTAGTLDLLTQGKLKQFADPNAPAIVALSPSQPPVITYGAGTAEDGHIKISWPNVEVSFYVLMFERFSRVFAVSTDISMDLAVFNDPATETLQISVVNGPNIDHFVENYNELLPGVNFQEVLESLVGVVFDAALGDQGLQFEYDVGTALSSALNVPIFIDFQGIETVPAGNREFLNVYLSMTDTQPQPQTVSPTGFHLADAPGVLRLPEAEDLHHVERASIPTGEAHIAVDDADRREFFVRVDFGAWRGPLVASGGEVVVHDPKLSLVGEHTLYVRSRFVDDVNSLEAAEDAAVSTVWVDPILPTVEVKRDGDVVFASAEDNVSAYDDLTYSWQLGDGAPGEFTRAASIDLDDVSASRVTVRVRDVAGNISKPAALDIATAKRRLKDEREAGASKDGGCAQTSASSASALFALALLAVVRRRRR